ncbi:ShlB/FhaC/HecB family hemolysin secretion/activation protein [Enterobacter pseudoroggenkampii]|uniref:ShlB/FhaC/HecB family hemolysin secretion/activation protein n=1 Tax=Enterobacter pseudoroggenkampii TaxID=2996112 RepID=UPI0025AF6E68|nr:ShlB/FhaC/HecB family hemolysin secretion/activation protein [Enterobacter pseudoroggenkampii]WJW96587.1 ShlB/FhaC/HecB family hemolysin secretion/activation protein [Enterobacter pseudoroggenkampii]
MPKEAFPAYRRFCVKKPLALCVSAALLLSGAPPALAGPFAVPNAGSLNNEARQAEPVRQQAPVAAPFRSPDRSLSAVGNPADNGQRVVLRAVDVQSGRLHKPEDDAALKALIAPSLGKPLSFAQLQELAGLVTTYYRDRGYLVARAVLPPQDLGQGRLVIRMIEGTLDTPQIHNASRLDPDFAAGMIDAGTCPAGCADSVAEQARIERTALLLNELPGVLAALSLQPGGAPGSTQISADLTPGKTWGGYVGADNMGNDSAGHNRALGGAYLNNLTGYGDQLKADLMLSSSADIFTGSLEYNAPVNHYGTRAGLSYSHLNYELKGRFTPLDAHGYSETWVAYLTHPLVRTGKARVDVRADAFNQNLKDSLLTTNQRRVVTGGTAGINGTVASTPQGLTGFGLSGTVGNLTLRDGLAQQFDAATLKTSGGFSRLNYRLNHDQGFGDHFSFYNQVSGQMASKNLDSSQKLLMGGPGGVRAYGLDEGAVDNGAVLTTELRTFWTPTLPQWAGQGHTVTAAAFFDQGIGQYNRHPLSTAQDNNLNMSGYGAYVALARNADYSLNLTWAHRTGKAASVTPDNDQFWISAYKAF